MRSILKSLAYDVVDACTGGHGVERVISGEPIRFARRWSRYYPGDYDPAKFAFLRAHCAPGDIVLDIGAHIGLFSVFMARLVAPAGRVFSFEPTPFTREVLEGTVRLNRCDTVVEVRAEAVAGTTGTAVLYDTSDELSNANSLVRGPRSAVEISARTITIDEFVEDRGLRVACIKIDVEGAELDVLTGAARTIHASRPAIEVEMHPEALHRAGRSLAQACELIQDYDLKAFHAGRPIDREWVNRQTESFDLQLLA